MGAYVHYSIRYDDRRISVLDLHRSLCQVFFFSVHSWNHVMGYEIHFRRIFESRPKRSVLLKLLALTAVVLFLLFYLKGMAD